MVILDVYRPVNRIEESNYLVRVLVRLKLLDHVADLLLAIVNLEGINNTLIC